MYGPKYGNNVNRSRPTGPRAAVLGSGPRAVPPAWRHQPPPSKQPAGDAGSKVFITGLPPDVDKEQIQELMASTIGPLRDTLCFYNKAGKATGHAVVHFVKTGDAVRARVLYHNKIIDQRIPIKVDLIVDSSQNFGLAITQAPPRPPPSRTLLDRLGGPSTSGGIQRPSQPKAHQYQPKVHQNNAMSIQQRRALEVQAQSQSHPQDQSNASRQRRKKGPRRLQKPQGHQKQMPKSADDLDKEMEDYRRTAPVKTDGGS